MHPQLSGFNTGRARRRLSGEGRAAQRAIERQVAARCKPLAEQIWSPFALAIGRPSERTREELAKRWRKRELIQMEWSPEAEPLARPLVRNRVDPNCWRVCWQVTQPSADPPVTRSTARRRRHTKWKPGDRDLWMIHLHPDGVSTASLFLLPVRTTEMEEQYGAPAIDRTAIALGALLEIERRLAAPPDEPVFIHLALADWRSEKPVLPQPVDQHGGQAFHLEGRRSGRGLPQGQA